MWGVKICNSKTYYQGRQVKKVAQFGTQLMKIYRKISFQGVGRINSSVRQMQADRSSETVALIDTTRRHIPEDVLLHSNRSNVKISECKVS